ncbi:hypothetical protein ACFC1T_34335 [Kitasatospora sp. NPDC056076]|uniref:hypothetical protein n=1 Tax=Kitasatospora sp. NPDC056076 TaxID=3345703 RepID=UPI0035E2A065
MAETVTRTVTVARTDADADADADAGSASVYLARVDELLAGPRPFPSEVGGHRAGYCGPGWWVEELGVSRDFWDGDDGAREREYELAQARLAALAGVFTARWGGPYEIDLWPHLRASVEGEDGGGHRPAPVVDLLCQWVVVLHVWPLPGGGRWLGLGLGQQDKELPVVLYAALADGPVPSPAAPAPDPLA